MAMTVGIRALKQNASAVVADAAGGEVVTVTDRGRPVAQLVPLPADWMAAAVAAGRARPAKTSLAALGAPPCAEDGELPVSEALAAMRSDQRY